MKLVLDFRKSLEENANVYFEKGKKIRRKIDGAKKAIAKAYEAREKAQDMKVEVKKLPKKIRKKAWYEKFKWFFASNGMLVIAGKDATTNEIVVKKHAGDKDIIFHTDAPGSPFVVLKTEGKEVSDEIKQEVGNYCGCHSKAWKLGLGDAEVYWVNRDQVTKETKAGEFMGKGSFMVYGTRNYVRPQMQLGACNYNNEVVMIGPIDAIKAQSDKYALVMQGDKKKSDSAKKIVKILEFGELDDIIGQLPSGTFKIERGK